MVEFLRDASSIMLVDGGTVLLFAVIHLLLQRVDRLSHVQRLFVAGGTVACGICAISLW